MKKYFLFLFIFFTVFTLSSVPVFADSEVHITQAGVATATGAKIMQLAGPTFYARLYWGTAFLRIVIKTNKDTKFLRGTGEATTLAEVHEGDFLDVSGQLEYGSESLIIIASTVKNVSVQKGQRSFSGTVTSIDPANKQFVLAPNHKKQKENEFKILDLFFGPVTVSTNDSTLFTKGHRTLDFAHLKIGDIVKTSGDYNLDTKVLSATSVVTYVDLGMYKPQNFQGTLKNISSDSITALIGNALYTINITSKTSVLKNNRSTISLSRFVPGDTVRIYGTAREIDDPVIDAEIVRNLSL